MSVGCAFGFPLSLCYLARWGGVRLLVRLGRVRSGARGKLGNRLRARTLLFPRLPLARAIAENSLCLRPLRRGNVQRKFRREGSPRNTVLGSECRLGGNAHGLCAVHVGQPNRAGGDCGGYEFFCIVDVGGGREKIRGVCRALSRCSRCSIFRRTCTTKKSAGASPRIPKGEFPSYFRFLRTVFMSMST